MNGRERLKEIGLLEEAINSKDIKVDNVIQKLDDLYCYKPVPMKLLALYSKALIIKGNPDEAVRRFDDCYTVESKADDNIMLWEQIIEAYDLIGRTDDAIRNRYMKSRLLEDSYYKVEDKKLEELKQRFIGGEESVELLEALENTYYNTGDYLMAFSIRLYMASVIDTKDVKWDKYITCANMMYLKERIDDKCSIIIVSDDKNSSNYDILAYIYHKLHLSVYMITEPISMDEEFQIESSVQISIDNKQEYDDCILIPSIAKYRDEHCVEDNIPYLVDAVCKNMTENDFTMVISSNANQERLRSFKAIANRYERLSDYYATYLEDKIGFGWCGDYYEYIGYLYHADVRAMVNREPEVKYSIVVPVRNATETLYHTLRTCIEQDYDGSYEVVLSDNSIEGHSVAYDTYKKLNNDKIRYYKTPRDLNLTKSYEYAYLQTRGKYIFSIGADDGVMPWALKRLDYLWDKNNPNRNIMCWDRGFYAWPGFNGGQENQFDISAHYTNEITGFINASTRYIEAIKENPNIMYALPNTYINSGFKRDYMKKLYDMTGRLFDGLCQDIYMGAQNLMLESEFLYAKYPITIAGMSPSSTGALCRELSLGNKKNAIVDSLRGGKSMYKIIRTAREALLPEMGTDVNGFYLSIEHLISKGIMPEDFYKDDKEIEQMYIKCYESLSLDSDKLYKFVYEGYEGAKRRSDKLAAWFEKVILPCCDRFYHQDKEKQQKASKRKMYKEGFNEKGGVTLDASRFGVTNIYEAVQLFKDFLHF